MEKKKIINTRNSSKARDAGSGLRVPMRASFWLFQIIQLWSTTSTKDRFEHWNMLFLKPVKFHTFSTYGQRSKTCSIDYSPSSVLTTFTYNIIQNFPLGQIKFSWQYIFTSSSNENFDFVTPLAAHSK